MADESVGKITLDLEVQSDIQKQVSNISNVIGNKLKASLEGATKRAFANVNKSVSDSTKNINRSIEAAFKRMKENMKKGVVSAYSAFKNAKMPKINFPKPSGIDTSAQAMPTMASPRGPPMGKINTGFNTNQLKAQIDNITSSLDNTNAKIEQQKSKLVELKRSYEYAFNPGLKSKLHEDILKTEGNIIKLTAASDKAGFKLADLDAQFEKLNNSTRKTASGIGAVNEKIRQTVKSASNVSGATKRLTLFNKAGEETGNSFRNAQSGMKGFFISFVKYGLLFMLMQKAIMALGTVLGSSLMVNAQFANSLAQIKTNLLVAFMPIYNAVLPALNALMSALATVTAYIASFTNALFGSTYKAGFGAAKNLQSSINAMKETAGAAGDAGKAIKKAAKVAKGALAGFDQLNILQMPKDEDSGGGSGGGGFQMVTPSIDMNPVEASMGALAEKLKVLFSPTLASLKNLWGAMEPFRNFVAQGAVDFWNNFLKPVGQWVFGEGIPRFIDALADGFGAVNWAGLNGNLNSLWKALAPFAINVGEGLLWLWKNVLVPLGVWTINSGLSVFLEILAGTLEILNGIIMIFKPAALWLWENFLLPLAQWYGGETIKTLIDLKDVISSFGAAIFIVMGAVSSWKAVTAIASVVTKGFGAAIAFLSPPISAAIIIIGSLIAIGVLLYKNWDTIKAKATELWTNVKLKFQAFKDWLGNVFAIDWSTRFGMFGDVMNGFLANIRNIWNGVKQIFNGIVQFVSGVFTGNWKKAWNGVANVFGGVFKTLSGIAKVPMNAVISVINGAISGLNKIKITIPDWVPGLGGKGFKVNIPKIPYLAQGGIVEQPTLAMVGEQGAEAVVPLENNTQGLDILASKLQERMNGAGAEQSLIEQILRKLDTIINRLQVLAIGGDIVLPIYIGNELLDQIIVKAQDRVRRKSNGRR